MNLVPKETLAPAGEIRLRRRWAAADGVKKPTIVSALASFPIHFAKVNFKKSNLHEKWGSARQFLVAL